MKFIIREKLGDRYFAEPGFGLTSKDQAHVFETDLITLFKQHTSTHISYKKEMAHLGHTSFDRSHFVIIPVGDL